MPSHRSFLDVEVEPTSIHSSSQKGLHTQHPRLEPQPPRYTILAVQAENQRAHVQYGIEMVKAARSRPIAYGDLGIIAMMRQGRP